MDLNALGGSIDAFRAVWPPIPEVKGTWRRHRMTSLPEQLSASG
jgi:hypothetical protein